MFTFVGQVSYARGLQLQAEAFARVRAGGKGEIIGLTHDPVFTLGRHAKRENLLNPHGIEVVETDRGGDITYHGPEQVLLYPIVPIPQGVKRFAWQLEEAIIRFLGRGERDNGVFVDGAKVGFLGLRVREGISTHGLSLNLRPSPAFAMMNPCGMAGLKVTSVQELTGRVLPHEEAARGLAQVLGELIEPGANENPRVSGEGNLSEVRASGAERQAGEVG